MIYNTKIPINLEQGDIYRNLPKITPIQLNFLEIKDIWLKYSKEFEEKEVPSDLITLKVQPIRANGVIISQSCDIIRPDTSILFGELKENKDKFSDNVEKRINQIKKIIYDETRNHYFPSDSSIKILKTPKILDFSTFFLVPYEFLKDNIKNYFVARLNPEARVVLGEKISRFFTRLAFERAIYYNDLELREYLKELSPEELELIRDLFKRIDRKFPDMD
jgi:Txe/YoeB family toxin of Txe-Axe toxin-antitoxin module